MSTIPAALAVSIVGHLRGYAIIGLGADGTVTHWLADARAITGFEEREMVGLNFSSLFTDADQAAGVDREELANAMRHGANEDCRWHRRKDGELFWGNGLTMRMEHDGAVLLKIFRDETAVKLAEERRILLLNELNHRVKNTLATVQSVTDQTLRRAGVDNNVQTALRERLMALSRAHNVLVEQNWAGADLGTLVREATKPYDRDPSSFTVGGPVVRFHPSQAVTISLVLHELATNAVKYGALSASAGRVDVTWNLGVDGEGGRMVTLLWRESGGPAVAKPTSSGFGTRLIGSVLAGEDGRAKIEYQVDGLRCSIAIRLVDTEAEPLTTP